MKYVLAFIITLFVSTCALAQPSNEAEAAFCQNILEQAAAQRDLLQSPSIMAGPVVPNTGTPPQMVVGATISLADHAKASLTMKAARSTCGLYAAEYDAKLHIAYALPKIENDVLVHRLELLDEASRRLDQLSASQEKMVQAGNLTRQAVYSLQSARNHLDLSRTATLTGIASPYVPPLTDVPLRVLIGEKRLNEEANQLAFIKLDKETGWDVEVGGGVHQQLGGNSFPTVSRSGAFAQFSLTYNLGLRAAQRHLDRSVANYLRWKETQFDDVTRQAILLKTQIEAALAVQQKQLSLLRDHDGEIARSLTSLEGLDNSNALTFKDQLLADRVIMGVDIDDVQFRVARLQQFLADNF